MTQQLVFHCERVQGPSHGQDCTQGAIGSCCLNLLLYIHKVCLYFAYLTVSASPHTMKLYFAFVSHFVSFQLLWITLRDFFFSCKISEDLNRYIMKLDLPL